MKKVVVLVGAGHAHLGLVNRAAAFLDRGVRLVLVDPGEFWYSGMATGMLSGQYEPVDDRVDVAALARSRGVDFVRGELRGIDLQRQRALLSTGEEMSYDALSLNVGSQVPPLGVPDDGTVRIVPAKPISGLASLRTQLEDRASEEEAMPPVAVIGGGATGTELAANLLGLAERLGLAPDVTLITSSEHLIPDLSARASKTLERLLRKRGLKLETRQRVEGVEGEMLATEKGEYRCEIAVLATGLVAASVVRDLGLPFSAHGLRVNRFLQSLGDPRVFAVGDCADFEPKRLPKLGVFGVRTAPVLAHNLLARARDHPLRAYEPQRIWLTVLNLGDGRGFLRWGPLWWQGWSSQRLKDYLDRRFMARFRS